MGCCKFTPLASVHAGEKEYELRCLCYSSNFCLCSSQDAYFSQKLWSVTDIILFFLCDHPTRAGYKKGNSSGSVARRLLNSFSSLKCMRNCRAGMEKCWVTQGGKLRTNTDHNLDKEFATFLVPRPHMHTHHWQSSTRGSRGKERTLKLSCQDKF